MLTVRLTKTRLIDPRDDGLEPVVNWVCSGSLSVGNVTLRRYGAANYTRNSGCDLCCVPNVA